MCGRFTLRTPPTQWVQQLFAGLELPPVPELPARYNVAPTQMIQALVQPDRSRPPTISEMKWGLIPSWATDASMGSRMINARAETVAEKPSFRKAFTDRRCLVVADGYYEWCLDAQGRKQAYWMHRPNEEVFMMAGIWEVNRKIRPTDPIISVSILTTSANANLSVLHDRMPVMIMPHDLATWLDPENRDGAHLLPLLKPAEDAWIAYRPVSTHVNNARHEDAKCLDPIG